MLFLKWIIFNPKTNISLISKNVNCFSLILTIYLILVNGGYMDSMIGLRIKERRKKLCITQSQIQEYCGISSGNLSGIETGRYLPSASALIGLSKILECSIDWILTGESLNSKNLDCIDIKEIDRQLLDYFHNMSQADQEDLMLIAEMKYNKRKRQETSALSKGDNITSGIA